MQAKARFDLVSCRMGIPREAVVSDIAPNFRDVHITSECLVEEKDAWQSFLD